MSTAAISAALAGRLSAPNGAGSYTYDLTAAGRVIRGAVAVPDVVPSVCLRLDEVTESPGPELGDFTRVGRWTVVGFVGGDGSDSDTPATRADAACDLMDDITRALRLDRGLSASSMQVIDLTVSASAFDGQAIDDRLHYGVAVVSVAVTWWEDGTP